MWNWKNWKLEKVCVIPVVIGALGIVTNKFEQWIKKLELDLTVEMLQKPCLIGMAGIHWKQARHLILKKKKDKKERQSHYT